MKKPVKIIIVILILLAAAGGGLYYLLLPDELEVVAAEPGLLTPRLNMTGNVEGNETITVYADVSGRIDKKYVNKGERVKKGDLLLTYVDDTQQYAVDVAQTNIEYDQKIIDAIKNSRASNQGKVNDANSRIAQCESVYGLLKLNIMSLDSGKYAKDYDRERQKQIIENDMIKLQDEVAGYQSELAKIESELKKAELLDFKRDVSSLVEDAKWIQDRISETNTAISRCQRDIVCLPIEGMDPDTYNRYIVLQNDLETVTRMWSEARTDRDTAQSMIRAYDDLLGNEQKMAIDELSLSQARNELEAAGNGCIAPSDGVITGCYINDGAAIEKGAPVFEMQKADDYRVKLLISKYDISSVEIGQAAVIHIGDTEYRGEVSSISQYAEADSSGKAKAVVYISLFTTDSLIVGMEADAVINLEELQASVKVPNECVYADDNGSYVFIVDDNSEVKRRYIETGVKDNAYTQILSGVDEGASIVYDPAAGEHEDEKVKEIMK
ncbi:MAG: HlyD family efflux transporter periplasmic adaptor subunit [Lachnospiraceae bacterium]|nr:HlyD family efflux transporter periplasmic adaptor subunit [Lachnospiraceae bacterium]